MIVLSNDSRRLRLFGVDLHSRSRRRVAVFLTYLVYVFGMTCVSVIFEDRRQYAVAFLSMTALTIATISLKLFRAGGPVKRMTDKAAVYKGKVLLNGLDDWSRYLYGDIYDRLAPAQQSDVLQRYKVGGYILPDKGRHNGFDPDELDERELIERNRASTRALHLLLSLLSASCGIAMYNIAHGRTTTDLPSLLLSLIVAGSTLPQAIILWTEPDPRDLLEPETVPPSPVTETR